MRFNLQVSITWIELLFLLFFYSFNSSYEYIYWGLSAAFELVQSRIERKFGKGVTS